MIQIQPNPDLLEEADIYFRKVRKVHRMMNSFLANQAYSTNEERLQIESLQRINTPQEEIDLVKEGWSIRRELAKKGREKLEKYIEMERKKL